ncbi:MAG: hypothetical protein ABFS05_04600 [Bacteroidota bacterium]
MCIFLYFRSFMKDIMQNILKKILAWLLVLSMGMLIVNKAVYLHVHKLENGTIVAHAHPFDKSNDAEPFKKHHHSDAEWISLSQIDTLFFLLVLIGVLLSANSIPILYHYFPKVFIPAVISGSRGRAPPVI